jgi:hypothetical protein
MPPSCSGTPRPPSSSANTSLTASTGWATGPCCAAARQRPSGIGACPATISWPTPNWQATRAQTIHAPAAGVRPWLMQLGYGRGGYYGDLPWWRGEQGRGVAASACRVLPELQHLDVDDVLLDGANCDATRGAWTGRSIEPERSPVLFSSRMLDGREAASGNGGADNGAG